MYRQDTAVNKGLKAITKMYEGKRQYELSNHLGNVLTVISDRRTYTISGTTKIYDAVVLSAQDYYPFGMGIDARTFSSTTSYRYSFNGKEDDKEWNKQDYGARIYDSRIGRFLSIDPKFKEFSNNSPYCYTLNNPIVLVDVDGEFPIIPLLLKMASNGAADYLMQVAMNYYFNDETRGNLTESATKNINRVQILRSSIEGAIPWKTPGGRVGKAAVTATYDVMQNYGYAKLEGKEYSGEQAIKDFALGFFGDLAGGGIGDIVAKYGAKSVAKGLKKIGFDAEKIHSLTGAGASLGLSKMERLKIFSSRLKNAEGASNPQEALKLINNTLDDIEDAFSGVSKNKSAIDMPNRDDGRMYGILDEKYVKKNSDGGLTARTKANVIIINKDGSFKIMDKNGEKTLIQKSGKPPRA
jgi:RHS repeat-associated protein